MKIEHTIDIDAPVERVWDLTVAIEALPDLTPTVTAVDRIDEGALEIGSQARLSQPGQRDHVWTVKELDPPHRFVWSTRAMGTTMTATHQLAGTERGTTNTLTIDIEGALAPIIGSLLRRPITKALATENEGFKTAAERRTHSEPTTA